MWERRDKINFNSVRWFFVYGGNWVKLKLERWRSRRYFILRYGDLKECKYSIVGWVNDRWSRDNRVGFFWLFVFEKRVREGVCKWMRKIVLCLGWGRVVV